MDSNADDTSDNASTAEASTAASSATEPPDCAACLAGVRIVDGNDIRACAECARGGRGHRNDLEAALFVADSLAALADVCELLWPAAEPDLSWSPDTIDEIAHRLEFLRAARAEIMADAIRCSGAITTELTYEDSDACYDGRPPTG